MFTFTNNRRGRRFAAALVATVIAVGIAFGAAAPANAYVYGSGTWGNGRVDVGTAYAVGKTRIVTDPMWVFGNGKLPNQQQLVTVRAELLIHTTQGWRVAAGADRSVWIGQTTQYAQVPGFALVPAGHGFAANQSGWYTLRYTVTWSARLDPITGAGSGVSGQAIIYAQHSGDIRCSIARCTPSPGQVGLY